MVRWSTDSWWERSYWAVLHKCLTADVWKSNRTFKDEYKEHWLGIYFDFWKKSDWIESELDSWGGLRQMQTRQTSRPLPCSRSGKTKVSQWYHCKQLLYAMNSSSLQENNDKDKDWNSQHFHNKTITTKSNRYRHLLRYYGPSWPCIRIYVCQYGRVRFLIRR